MTFRIASGNPYSLSWVVSRRQVNKYSSNNVFSFKRKYWTQTNYLVLLYGTTMDSVQFQFQNYDYGFSQSRAL